MSILGDLREVAKGTAISPSDESRDMLYTLASPLLTQNSLASNIRTEPAFSTEILETPAPKNVDYRNRKSSFHIDQYARASYYFYHCSIVPTTVLRITQEAIRNGLDWKPKFQSKCPRCGHEYQKSTRKCTVCDYEGDMILPDESQKDLLVNWEGTPLLKKVNRNGWDMLQLVRSFLIISLTYNQPVILCKSTYLADEHGNVLEEFPQEFIPVSPTKAKMIYDETGQPGNNMGFCITDRKSAIDLSTEQVSEEMFRTGYYNNKRYYPCAWAITETDGGFEDGGDYFAEQEIYHDTYMLPSVTYGTPLCLLVEANIRAWMAMELRTEKYYSTGHPPGVFIINNITPDSTSKLQQSIRMQMREDPYTIPVLGIPPASDKATSTKWHPFSVDPAESMIAVKQELLQRITAIFGMSGLFLGDTDSMKGNSNEAHQIALLDRNLVVIRGYVNKFLDWIIHKYKGITDWVLKVVEPSDNQALDEAEKFNKQLLNAKLAKDLGFEIISQNDGKIEISATPQSYDPIKSLFGDGGGKEAEGLDGDMSLYKTTLSKDGAPSGDTLEDSTFATRNKGETLEQRLARAILNGEVNINDIFIRN